MEKHALSKWILISIFQALLLFSSHTYAAKVVLDFEGVGDLKPVNNFYNNNSTAGAFPNRNYGVSFHSSATGLVDLDSGGSGNFANEPSNDTAMFFGFGGIPIMNVASGFDTGFSLNYSYALSQTATINIYDGLDGTGTLLSSFILTANVHDDCKGQGDPFGDFCRWNAAGVKFKGLAKSVVFGGPAEAILYDDLTLGSDHPGMANTPLPGAFWLMGPALVGLMKFKRRV